MGRRQTLLLSLAALMLCTVSADALRQLQQSEVKVCRYACGMGMECINGVCRATSVNDLSSDSPAVSAEAALLAPSDSAPLGARLPSNAAEQMSPVPLESSSDEGSAQDRLNAERAASMSFIDTSADTATISIAPSNSLEPGVVSVVVVGPAPAEQPPAEQSPAEQSPAEQSPAEQSPAEQSPAEQSPAEQSPAEQSPSPAPSDSPSPASVVVIEPARAEQSPSPAPSDSSSPAS